ncbi:hypothetical protein [Marinifilum caeruleilacunae]|uniref:DUF2812 domain-containing protein n=1 Tax=Marinifilum caeruleilacunae TaxID=2499076 RepID=A0ABX1WYS9_9BACT|nr:hypothetical protein [Marinifilum caeruleilacunae]NOU61202.1 hypothetical protein [Marinifilum caeruleilacunae]
MQKLIGFNIKRNKKLLVSDIIKFYEVRGYELTDADARGMVFKRGSIWGNMTSLDPTKWRTKVDIEIIKKERLDYNIYASYKFTTSGFYRSQTEENYYTEELNAFSKAIESFEIDPESTELLVEKTNKSTLHLITKSLLFGIPVAILLILITNSLLTNRLPISIASLITAISILAFYVIFIGLRKKA